MKIKSRNDFNFFIYKPSESGLRLNAINFCEFARFILIFLRYEFDEWALTWCKLVVCDVKNVCLFVNGDYAIGKLKHVTPWISLTCDFNILLFIRMPVTSGLALQSNYFISYLVFFYIYVDLIIRYTYILS